MYNKVIKHITNSGLEWLKWLILILEKSFQFLEFLIKNIVVF